jgi:hypothetical protein
MHAKSRLAFFKKRDRDMALFMPNSETRCVSRDWDESIVQGNWGRLLISFMPVDTHTHLVSIQVKLLQKRRRGLKCNHMGENEILRAVLVLATRPKENRKTAPWECGTGKSRWQQVHK